MTEPDPELTAQQIAAYLNCTVTTIYYWRKHDIGPRTYRRGKRVYARKSDIDAWRRDHEAATARGGVRVPAKRQYSYWREYGEVMPARQDTGG
jgi:predicted DNA-binding transcriptional regulator AlpA